VDNIVHNEKFRANVVLLGIDEAYVLIPWGDSLPAYHQVGLMHKRLPSHVIVVTVSATLTPGQESGS
jgi:superfamily II DNA helicase RecQ